MQPSVDGCFTRRSLLASAGAISVISPLVTLPALGAELVEIMEFDAAGRPLGAQRVPKIVKSEAEWRRVLSPESFEVTRTAGTEQAFTGAYWNLHKDGLFHCVCCATVLFDSHDKFDSGTGWPSFTRPIARENVVEKSDHSFGMERTEIVCRRCDAHLGHVFDDGPRPTGLRYCMNSASLVFVPRAEA